MNTVSSEEYSSSDEDIIQLINILPRNKLYKVRRNPIEIYDDVEFIRRYRFKKETVLNMIDIFNINDFASYPTNKNIPITPLNQLLLTLKYYATGSYQQALGDIINIDKSTVCRIIPRITALIARKSRDFIKMPVTEGDKNKTVSDFHRIKSFPGVIGAIDCTHIKIQSPGGANAELFRNQKGWFSINIQVVCDANLKILDIVSRWPGSVQDCQIFNSSSLRVRFEAGEFGNFWLLGDSGYGCKTYLLTPILNPTNTAEEKYNDAHIQTRNVIERAFGVMKRRFPCLANGIRMAPKKAVNIIVAVAVLHNIAIETQDIYSVPEPEDYFPDVALTSEIICDSDIAVRRALVNTHFSS